MNWENGPGSAVGADGGPSSIQPLRNCKRTVNSQLVQVSGLRMVSRECEVAGKHIITIFQTLVNITF